MRLLHRFGNAECVGHRVVLAVHRRLFLREHATDDLTGLVQGFEAAGNRLEIDAEVLMFQLEPAGADAEVEAAAADVIERRRHLGEHARVAVGIAVHEMTEARAFRGLRTSAQRRPALEAWVIGGHEDRVEMVEVPQRVVTPRVGLLPQIEHGRPLDTLLSRLDAESNWMLRHDRSLRRDVCRVSFTGPRHKQHAAPRARAMLKTSGIGATFSATVILRGVVGVVVMLLAAAGFGAAAADETPQPLSIGAGERLVVIAPHPDDETLGAGGLIQRVIERGGSVSVVLVTAGDGYVEAVIHETHQPLPRPAEFVAYGKRRLAEEHAALRTLGRGRVRLQFLGFPDGGLEALVRTHWRRTHPERSRTTDASDPPYADAVEPDVPYDGTDLRRELVRILRATDPTLVVLPDPLDKHPDHHAAGIFALLAVNDWVEDPRPRGPGNSAAPLPRLLAYLVHWAGWRSE